MSDSPDLFDYALQQQLKSEAPLADRMRPQTLDQFVGQSHILSAGRLLRRAIQADQLSSLIFFGPPGTGKTTLARIIANTTKAQFISLNAVLSGVKDIRAGIDSAQRFRKEYERKTILFIDEVHRFNKAQQDALLPHVENGTVILIGATTENPYFEVNKALVSRSRVFQLKSLDDQDLEQILEMTLKDEQRGYGKLTIEIEENARQHLVKVANGDARALLNALELAVQTSEPDRKGTILIDLAIAEESIQRKAVLYDKDGDAHFDTISAFIKSMRGSDPDAALYWMAKMVYGGEDPRFLFRRMIIFASEDIGMADPKALQVVVSAAQAFDYVGMPEGRFHLAQACLYLSTAPKCNSAFAFFDALDAVEKEKTAEPPDPVRDGNRDKEGFGHGKGYLYPHAYQDHWVAQQYLPDGLQGRLFYQPTDQGFEASIKPDVIRRREVQLAATMDLADQDSERQVEYWQGRTLSNTAEVLADIRDILFSRISFDPHAAVLVLNAGDGVLLGELMRQAKGATIYGQLRMDREKQILSDRYAALDELSRPVLLVSDPLDANAFIDEKPIQFDIVMGRNCFSKTESNQPLLEELNRITLPEATLMVAETIPAEGQRLSSFIESGAIEPGILGKLKQAEDTAYTVSDDNQAAWSEQVLISEMEATGFKIVALTRSTFFNKTMITQTKLNEWFGEGSASRKSFRDYLRSELSEKDIATVQQALMQKLAGQVVDWKSSWVFIKAQRP